MINTRSARKVCVIQWHQHPSPKQKGCMRGSCQKLFLDLLDQLGGCHGPGQGLIAWRAFELLRHFLCVLHHSKVGLTVLSEFIRRGRGLSLTEIECDTVHRSDEDQHEEN